LEEALKSVAPEGAPALTATSDAFLHLARRSKARLVLLIPFVDVLGLRWATGLFRVTSASNRIFIVRDRAKLEVYCEELTALQDLGVRILEYRVSHPVGVRQKPIETFHAKIVMADGCAAYVGSANLLESSHEVALECGFMIEGPAVSQVADLVEAVLQVAESCT
jgi:phosphatidylserine/phosphatidylglycerophosphate/cardiolipin synthase-like enzyme